MRFVESANNIEILSKLTNQSHALLVRYVSPFFFFPPFWSSVLSSRERREGEKCGGACGERWRDEARGREFNAPHMDGAR